MPKYFCQVLCLVYASHNGISEMELFDLVPSLQWSHWSLLCYVLIDWHILSYLSGLLVFAHEQVSLWNQMWVYYEYPSQQHCSNIGKSIQGLYTVPHVRDQRRSDFILSSKILTVFPRVSPFYESVRSVICLWMLVQSQDTDTGVLYRVLCQLSNKRKWMNEWMRCWCREILEFSLEILVVW